MYLAFEKEKAELESRMIKSKFTIICKDFITYPKRLEKHYN